MKTNKRSLVWLTAFVLSLSTGAALAQERLFIMRRAGELSELDTTDANLGAVRAAAQLPAGTRALRLAGGRYLLLYAGYPVLQTALAVFDTRTSTTAVLPSFSSPVVFEADDFRPRLFYRSQEAIGVIEPPTFAPRELLATRTELFGFTGYALFEYVEATNSLVLARQVTSLQVEIVSIDAETGAVRGVIPADGVPQALLVDNVGRRLYVPARQLYGVENEIRIYDLVTLELLAKSGSYDLPFEVTWRFDVMRRQILVGVHNGQQGSGSGPWALSLDTDLKPHARVDFSYLEFDRQLVHKLELMPSTARERTFAVLARGAIAPHTLGQWQLGRGVLVGMDADRLQPMAHADLHVIGESFATDIVDAILLAPPPPPSALAFTVVGQHVELTWRNPGDATHFMVEAGTIAGRSNLGIMHVGNATAWSVDNVPSGTYYVRVRAGNDVGPSLPSNEVVVTVP